MSETPKTWRNERVLGLCALVALLLAGGTIGLWVYRSERQRRAVEALTDRAAGAVSASIAVGFPDPFELYGRGNSVFYGYELGEGFLRTGGPPPGPHWLREWLGIDYLATVRSVSLNYATDDQMRSLNAFPGLRQLMIHEGTISAAGFQQLKGLAQLQNLDLYSMEVSDNALAILPTLPNLQILTIQKCYGFTDAGCDHLSKIKSLRDLTLFQNFEITGLGLAKLARLTNLERLTIYLNARATDAVLEQVQALPSLRHLNLSYNDDGAEGGLKYLGGLKKLEELWMFGSHALTDDMLDAWPPLPGLKSLELAWCQRLTGAVLKNLDKLPNLRRLELYGGSQIDGAALAHLKSLPKLIELTIFGEAVRLTDADLEVIGQLSTLRALRFYRCGELTDAGLAHLTGLTNLELLNYGPSTPEQFSPAALAALGASLPRCKIEGGRSNLPGD